MFGGKTSQTDSPVGCTVGQGQKKGRNGPSGGQASSLYMTENC